jgi:DNA-binding MarR family transcriptional regulator
MSSKWNSEKAWDLADIVGRSYALISELSDKVATEEGVTTARVIALAVLNAFPEGISQTEWGKHQGVSRQRASVIAQELEMDGDIKTTPQGRSTIVSLTTQGTGCVRRYKQVFGSALGTKLNGFSKHDGKQLTSLLGKLIASIENADATNEA